MRRILRFAMALCTALPAIAHAGEGEAVLRFRDGRLVPGTVVELTAEGVRHRSEHGVLAWKWEDLTLFSRYEVRAAVLDDDDGAGRLALGRWCLENGLPSEARTELRRAAGLGAGGEDEIRRLLDLCDSDEAEAAFAEADGRAENGDLEGALSTLRSYLLRAPVSEWTTRARERAADLVRRIELEAERARVDAAAKEKDRAAEKRRAYVAGQRSDGDAARTRAGVAVLAVLREEADGSVTRFRSAAGEAEARFLEARKAYERARVAAGDELPDEARGALEARRAVEGRLLDLHLRVARVLVGQKMWEPAQAALDRALRLDPVNEEGLDLQDRIDAGRIRRKASDLTNASGHSTDGTGGNR